MSPHASIARALGLALVAATSALSTPALAQSKPGIVAGDNRVIAKDPRFRAVGRLNKSGTGFCTATLIAPDLVLTAAHCLYYGKTKRPIPPDRLVFAAGWRKGKPLAWSPGRKISQHPDYDHRAPLDAEKLAADIALVWLERGISPRLVPPMPIDKRAGSVRLSVPITHVSYATDRAHLPSVEHGCVVREEQGPLLLTDCDANFGGSGAPLLSEEGGELRILGVMAGVMRVGAFTRTGAVRATHAKAALPDQ